MSGLNRVLFDFINGATGRFFFVDWLFIFLSEALIYIIAIAFIALLFKIKDWKKRTNILALGILSVILSRGVITPLIRFFIESPRPFVALGIDSLVSHSPTPSFPSGHITFILPLAMALFYINKVK